MDHNDYLEAGGFFFIHNFDSGNLGHVEQVPNELILSSLNHRTNNLEKPDYEFNVWTRPDCAGTQFENGNRTWFYFGVQGGQTNTLVRLNIINLNKQGKMYNQGMAPVTRTLPGQPHWERIRDRPVHSTDDNTFTLTFKYKTPDNIKATTFFAFTYPFSFSELQMSLNAIDLKLLPLPHHPHQDDIYYCRENLIYTLDNRRTDLLTISSYHGITGERENRLRNCFPGTEQRPFKFSNKKVIFVSARVHPGETPSSFVFNGFLNLLLNKSDPIAMQLRKLYVFKLIPFLNPDGVARGHYRTDTRGVNLNRVYLNPSLEHHPTVYAARALIRYHHFGYEKEEELDEIKSVCASYSRSITCISEETLSMKKKQPKAKEKRDVTRASPSRSSARTVLASKSVGSGRSSSASSAVTIKRERNNTDDSLADQVCDLKLQEMRPNKIVDSKVEASSWTDNCSETPGLSLLDDVVVRDCLGSEVHLSRSDELSCIQGPNPLRQLRDTLKNSISLLMGNKAYPTTIEDPVTPRDNGSWSCDFKNVFTGVDGGKGEELDPSLVNSPDMAKCIADSLTNPNVFCTTCYKNDPSDLSSHIKLCESSGAVSGGDRVGVSSQQHSSEEPTADSNGDNAETTKTPGKSRKKQNMKHYPILDRKHLKEPESNLFLYVDLHGHASKKGIFMYGNHFEEIESSVECMLLPRIMSLNNLHFHFSSCNFTERNMYLKDRRDGMSREGSGRVAVLKATGLVRSYTLECNYNTGRLVNVLPPTVREPPSSSPTSTAPAPPKYTPHIFEEVGRSLGHSILDLTGHNPNSRIPGSEHRSLGAVRDWLRSHMRTMRPQLNAPRLRSKPISPTRAPLYSRTVAKNKLADVERKENTYIGAKPEGEPKKPSTLSSSRSTDIIVDRYAPQVKKNDKTYGSSSRSRCSSESEPKAKSLSAKRRNVLAIRKPNAGKARSIKPKTTQVRRSPDEPTPTRSNISKKSKGSSAVSARSLRREGAASRACKPLASSSSEEATHTGWDEVASGGSGAPPAAKRRPHPPPLAPRLKKIRLKTTS